MKKYIIILISFVIIFCAGCSPQKRLNRLYKNSPELFTTDTIIVKDSIIIPEKHLQSDDIIIDYTSDPPDTVITFEQDGIIAKLTLKPIAGLPGKGLINLEITVPKETIPFEKAIIIDKSPKKVEKNISVLSVLIVVIVIAIIIIILMFYSNKKKDVNENRFTETNS